MTDKSLLDDDLLAGAPVYEGYKTLGPIVLFHRIGRGGMGAVYLGRHIRMNLDVAVKILAPPRDVPPGDREQYVQRFVREAQTAGAIRHANLVHISDVDAAFGVHYLVMEYVDGESAQDRLDRIGTFSERQAVSVCRDAARGLGEAHARGVVHRDVKPDNILIADDGRAKVADLGLAKAVDRGTANAALTVTHSVFGTPNYMSPEQTRSAKNVGPAADVWSLGVTLYQLLTGGPPWFSADFAEQVMLIRKEPHRPIREIRPEVSEGCAAIVDRCLCKDPEERYADGNELAAALDAHLATLPEPADEPPPDIAAQPTLPLTPSGAIPPNTDVLERISRQLASQTASPVGTEPTLVVQGPSGYGGGVDDTAVTVAKVPDVAKRGRSGFLAGILVALLALLAAGFLRARLRKPRKPVQPGSAPKPAVVDEKPELKTPDAAEYARALRDVPDTIPLVLAIHDPGSVYDRYKLAEYRSGLKLEQAAIRAMNMDGTRKNDVAAAGVDFSRPMTLFLLPDESPGIRFHAKSPKDALAIAAVNLRRGVGDSESLRIEKETVGDAQATLRVSSPPDVPEKDRRIERAILTDGDRLLSLRPRSPADARAILKSPGPGGLSDLADFKEAVEGLSGDALLFIRTEPYRRRFAGTLKRLRGDPDSSGLRAELERKLKSIAPFRSLAVAASAAGKTASLKAALLLSEENRERDLFDEPRPAPDILERIPGPALACLWMRIDGISDPDRIYDTAGEHRMTLGVAEAVAQMHANRYTVNIREDVLKNLGGEIGVVLYDMDDPPAGALFIRVRDMAAAERTLDKIAAVEKKVVRPCRNRRRGPSRPVATRRSPSRFTKDT